MRIFSKKFGKRLYESIGKRTYEIWWLKMAAGKAHINMENQIEGTSTKFIININKKF